MNVTQQVSKELYDKTWIVADGILSMDNDIYIGQEKCTKPCTIQKSMVLFNQKEPDYFNRTYLTLIFDDEVVHTTKKLGYGPSEFLIDMGSSLGQCLESQTSASWLLSTSKILERLLHKCNQHSTY